MSNHERKTMISLVPVLLVCGWWLGRLLEWALGALKTWWCA